VGHRSRLDGCGKSRPYRDSIPGLRYPGPHSILARPTTITDCAKIHYVQTVSPNTERADTNTSVNVCMCSKQIRK
jgi:hypothetical protein